MPRQCIFALLALLLAISFSSAEPVTEIYTSQYVSAEKLSQTLQKIYPNSKLTTQGNQLIIRADSNILNEIQELLPILDKATQQFTLSFSSRPQQRGNKIYGISKNSLANKTFTLSDGETLSFDYSVAEQQLNTIGLFYRDLESVDVDRNSISITITVIAEQQLKISYRHYQLKNGKRITIQNTIQVELGEWLSLSGEAMTSHNSQSWSSSPQPATQLYARISGDPD